MKQLGVLLLLPGWDVSPLHREILDSIPPVLIYTRGYRETMWSKVSCLHVPSNQADLA